MVLEGLDHLACLHAPLFDAALFVDEFVHVVNGRLYLHLRLLFLSSRYLLFDDLLAVFAADGGDLCCVFVHDLLKLLQHSLRSGLVIQGEVVRCEVGADVRDAGIDDAVVLAFFIDGAVLDLLFDVIPFVGAAGVADELLQAGAADVYVGPDGALSRLVDVVLFEVESDLHTLPFWLPV